VAVVEKFHNIRKVTVGAWTLEGAAIAMAVEPGLGTAIGAGIGLVIGLLTK